MAIDTLSRRNAAASDQAGSELAGGSGLVQAIAAPGPVTLFNVSHTVVGTFGTIQAAVNAAADNYTIEVGAGTYVEQVVIDNIDGLTIVAAVGAVVTIQAPADVVQTGTKASGQGVEAVVTVLNSADVTIDNINVFGHGAANTVTSGNDFVGVFYRNSSGSLLTVDISGVRDPYENGTTAGGHPVISGLQRGQGVLVSNDNGPHLAFTMTGGSITDFQKTGINVRNADLDISGVTITGGGAQTINAQNGIQVQLSTGTIDGNTISGIGYAGTQSVYSAGLLLFANTGLDVTGNSVTGSNGESTAGKIIGIGILDFGIPNSGGQVSGNTLSFVDIGISADGAITPDAIAIHDNNIANLDSTDPFADGVFFAPDSTLTIAFDVEGTGVQDTLSGAAGNDTLTGLGGNDEFQGNGGDDSLHGDAGADQADYAGNLADYTIGYDTDGGGTITGFLAVTDNNAGNGDEGADTLSSIELLKFADIVLNLADPVRLFDQNDALVGTFGTIQAAIDAAGDNARIELSSGTYAEQLTIDGMTGLTIQAAAGASVTVISPDVLAINGTSDHYGDNVRAVIGITDSTNVHIEDIVVDGSYSGDTTPGSNGDELSGIAFLNSSGGLDGVTIDNNGNSPAGGLFGLQHGSGLFIDNSGLLSGNDVTVTGSTITDFQKTGALIVGADIVFNGNTITGIGATGLTAQNGIQIALSQGELDGNTITGIGYTVPMGGTYYYASGIIAYEPSGPLSFDGNTITGVGLAGEFTALDLSDTQGVGIGFTNNIIADATNGIIAYTYTGGALGLDAQPDFAGTTFTNISVNGIYFDPELSFGAPFTTMTDFSISGTDFVDALAGSQGGDIFFGGAAEDDLSGRDGDDFLDGGAGADRMDGGDGDDSYLVDDAGDQVLEAAAQGRDVVYASVDYKLAAGQEVEILSSVSQAATTALQLVGNELGQEIYGNAGANFLQGGGGTDYLVGLGGNDVYFIAGPGDNVVESAGGGTDIIYTPGDYTMIGGVHVELLASSNQAGTNAQTLIGNEFDQTIYGNAGANFIEGGGGTDTLVGLAGNDVYVVDSAGDYVAESAGGGRDVVYAKASYTLAAGQEIEVLSTTSQSGTTAIDLTGNNLANALYGNAGANVLNGGAGGDYLQGFGGADSFAFTTALGGGNVDTLADFVSGTDKILLDHAVFAGLSLGALSANAFVAGTQAGDADDRIVYNSATGQLFFDADGSGAGAQVLFATLDGHPPLNAGDFTVI